MKRAKKSVAVMMENLEQRRLLSAVTAAAKHPSPPPPPPPPVVAVQTEIDQNVNAQFSHDDGHGIVTTVYVQSGTTTVHDASGTSSSPFSSVIIDIEDTVNVIPLSFAQGGLPVLATIASNQKSATLRIPSLQMQDLNNLEVFDISVNVTWKMASGPVTTRDSGVSTDPDTGVITAFADYSETRNAVATGSVIRIDTPGQAPVGYNYIFGKSVQGTIAGSIEVTATITPPIRPTTVSPSVLCVATAQNVLGTLIPILA